jgi:hypothetical protein
MKKIKGLKEVKDIGEVVYRAEEQKILSPKEEMLRTALKYKTWLYGETKDTLNGVDYTMYDFTLSGLSGFTPEKIQKCKSDLDILRLFYSCLYPFIDQLVTQYEFCNINYNVMKKEYKPLIRQMSESVTDKKIALEYIESLGKLKEYETYEKDFRKTILKEKLP